MKVVCELAEMLYLIGIFLQIRLKFFLLHYIKTCIFATEIIKKDMKTVLITGATSGIGLGCARKFAQNGDRLILTGRNTGKLSAISSELQAQGTEVLTLAFDVRDREAARQAIESLPAAWQQIDVLVNNAGLALGLEP